MKIGKSALAVSALLDMIGWNFPPKISMAQYAIYLLYWSAHILPAFTPIFFFIFIDFNLLLDFYGQQIVR
jgi:hypothetical protein